MYQLILFATLLLLSADLSVANSNVDSYELPAPFVLYGKVATQGQFPFAGWLSTCSASILDSRTILTAGHCVCRTTRTRVLLGAVVGASPELGSMWVDLDTSKVYIHPNYTRCNTVGKDDIAILKTKEAINFDKSIIQPIELYSRATQVGDSVTISGYGRDETGKSGVLRYATSNVRTCVKYTGAVCQSMSPNSPYYGDSGGPLFVTVSGTKYQVGVVSGGDFTNNQAIYANVYDSLEWIKSNMG